MLSLDTAYRSFGGEVEASSTPTICRLSDSRRHQLSAIAPLVHVNDDHLVLQNFDFKVIVWHHKSSRKPLKKGCLTLPSADFARYSISASSSGSTQIPRWAMRL